MRCFAAVAAALLVSGSSLALGGSSKAADNVEQLFVTICVRYAISFMGKQETLAGAALDTSPVARNCQIHLSKSGDFCTGYAELVSRRADQATLNQFCQTEYQKLHAGSLGVSNGTQQIQVHAQTASTHAGSKEATSAPEQKTCQERIENIIRLQLPHKAASKVVRLDCAQRFGRRAPLCKDVVKLFGQGNVQDTCKLLARKRPDMAEFCRRTTGKMVGTGLDGGALREAARDLCEMEFEQAPTLHVREGCRFYADHLVKAHLDGSSNVSHFCATLTQRPPSRQDKAAPVVVQKAGPTSTNAGQQSKLTALSSSASHHGNSPTAEQRRPKNAASTGKALHSVSPVQPLASTAKPRTRTPLDSLHAFSPSGAQKASAEEPAKSHTRVQIPKTNTAAVAPKVVAAARRIIPLVRRDVPQKTNLPTKGASSGALPETRKQSDKTAEAPISHPAAAKATATASKTASPTGGSSAAAAALPAAAVPPTGVAATDVPTASVEDADHSADSFFGVPDAGTVDGVLSAMASMPTALPLSDVASVPSAEANGITVKTGAFVPAANSEAAATAAEDNFLSNFLGEYGKSSGPKDVAVQHDPAAQQKALTAALAPADVVVGPGAADVDSLVSSFLARSG